MGKLNEAQRDWLIGIGITLPDPGPVVDPTAEAAAPGLPAPGLDGPRRAAASAAPYLDLNSPEMKEVLRRSIFEQAEKDKKEAEKTLAQMNQTLLDIQTYVARLSGEHVSRASYAGIMAEVRRQFPEAAGLSQWVKDTSNRVPELKGKLPSRKALMNTVEAALKARNADLGWQISSGNPLAVNSDRLLAAYMSELPAGVTVSIAGGVVQLSLEGAALAVATPAGDVDASAGKAGTKLALKGDDYSIQVENSGWSDFDPELRAEWKKIQGEASTLVKLKADRDKARLELEQKKKDGAELAADLTVDFEKREAEFNLAWKKLQERVAVSAKASEAKISASIAYLKKDKNDKDAVKAGLEAEVDLKAMQGKLKAYYATPSIEAVLAVTAAADKVTATLELKAVKSGAVVTARFERALDETKAAIEVLLREGKTKIAAELKQKADELTAKIKVVHETKDLKLAAELEKTLADVRGSIEVAYTQGRTTVKGGGNVSSTGEAGGKVQIDIALKDGRSFIGDGDKLSFAANVSNKGYKFEVTFSMGEPVDTGSLQDLFADADRQIKELYKLAGDKGVRSIEDAKALNAKLQEVMEPINAAAAKVKTLKKKSEISASFGFSVEGEWPAGGKAAPPVASFGVTLRF